MIVVFILGMVFQTLGKFKETWIVLLAVPLIGVIELWALGGFFTGFFGLLAGFAALVFREHDIKERLERFAA